MIPGSANTLLLATAAGGGGGGYEVSRSLRFNSADSAYLSRTPGSAGNRKTWTWAGWVKRSGLSSSFPIFSAGVAGTSYLLCRFRSGDTFGFDQFGTANNFFVETIPVYRDASAWYHLVFAFDTTQSTQSNRIKVYINGVEQALTAGTNWPAQNADLLINDSIAHSIGSDVSGLGGGYLSGYLADIHFIDGQALDPTSFGEFDTNGVWQPKAFSGGSYGTNGFHLDFADNSSAAALGYDAAGSNDWTVNNIAVWNGGAHQYSGTLTTNGSWAPGYDPSKSFDGSTATVAAGSSGGEINTWTASSYGITVNTSLRVYAIAAYDGWTVNGTSQGSIAGAGWVTASLTPPYTLNSIVSDAPSAHGGFFAAIEVDGAILVDKTSGTNDSLRDSPTNGSQTDTGVGGEVVGNYCVLNPLKTTGVNANASDSTLSDGNLVATSSSTGWDCRVGSLGVSTGKWYYEYVVGVTVTNFLGGWADAQNLDFTDAVGNTSRSYGYYNTGNTRNSNNNSATNYGSYTTGDVISCAIDLDNAKIYWAKNGTWINSANPANGTGSIYTVTTGYTYFPAVSTYDNTQTVTCNFGQRAFAYTAPSGFSPLVDTLLPTPTIAKPNTVMDVVTYTGNGSSRSITGLGFNPDLVWIKGRSGATDHALYDVVRGAEKRLESNNADAEVTSDGGVTAFNSDGFSLGTLAQVNTNSATYVGWTWDAGSSNATNTSGTITSTVRANISAGFSVVTYTGTGSNATVGHGLGVAPSFIVIKNRDGLTSWAVYHTSLGATKVIRLNSTNAADTDSTYWNDTSPTSSLFSLGSDSRINANGDKLVAYCWAPVAGYSAFGSYTGNGSSDGPFVYTGFRPRWVMIKRTDSTSYWHLYDTARNTYNTANTNLWANGSDAEISDSAYNVDITSNGFKLRTSDAARNASGGTYVYAAFAEHPFQSSRAR